MARRRLSVGIAGALFLGSLVATPASATTAYRVVDDDALGRPGNCAATKPAYASVQSAVDASASGDVVIVCPGTFPEKVTVVKTLELSGAQAGVDARARSAPESIVTGGLSLNADDIVLDGFTIQNVANDPTLGGSAVFTNAAFSGYRIENNIIADNVFGLYLNSEGTSDTVVRTNSFQSNNDPGPVSGTGIYSDQGLDNATITANAFGGHASAAINLGSPSMADIEVSANDSSVDATLLVLFNAVTATIATNTFAGPGSGSGIFLGGNNASVDVVGNDVTGATSALNVTDIGFGVNTGPIDATNNSLTGNTRGVRLADDTLAGTLTVTGNEIAGNTQFGIVNLDNEGDVLVDGRENWWGASDGPSDWSIGSGDAVSAEVDFFPWFTDVGMTTLETCDASGSPGTSVPGTSGSDILCGSAGTDGLFGGEGADLLLGFGGRDKVRGGDGDDALIGHEGSDVLDGLDGVDDVQGRQNVDSCTGERTSTCP